MKIAQPWMLGILVVASLGLVAAPATAIPARPPVAGTPTAFDPLSAARFVRTMQRGKASYNRGDFVTAQQEFQSALVLRPDSAEALYDLGQAQYRVGRFAAAAGSFEKVADSTPATVEEQAAYDAGNSLYRQKQLPQAAAEYEKALLANQHDEAARYNLQVVLDKLQQQKQQKQPENQQDKSKGQQGKGNPQQANRDQSKGQQGKGNPQQANSSPPAGGPRVPPAPAGPVAASQAAQRTPDDNARDGHRPPAGADGAQTDRILQYYRDQERQLRVKPGPTTPYQPPPGAETW